MYAVFERTLQTDKGKALVRIYQDSYDAQTIYKELKEYSMKSTKASLDSRDLLSYISSSRLGDGKWNGTAHSYILHWQDQVRKYEELVSTKDHLSDSLKRIMLENAVYKVPELRSVKIAADQHKAQSGTELTYEQYSGLLCSAAQQHDAQFGVAQKQGKSRFRQAYVNMLDEDDGLQEEVPGYDIDTDVNDIVFQVHRMAREDPGTRIPQDTWEKLPSSDKSLWRQLQLDTKRLILGQATDKILERATHVHDTMPDSDLDIRDVVDDVQDESRDTRQDDEMIKVMNNEVVKPKKKLPPGDLRRLLAGKQEGGKTTRVYKTLQVQEDGMVNVNGETYKVATTQVMYRASNAGQYTQGTLIDRGANGGIVGQDMRVIEKSTRTVNVQGNDNHQLTNIPLVTAGAVVTSQKGDIIAIVHQYAYTGKGKSIHSSGQLEWFRQHVDDKSRRVGGKQTIITVDGYVLPLHVRDGLPYLDMRPYTDAEWETLPHVIMTSEDTWDPSVLDDDPNADPFPEGVALDDPIDLTGGLFDEYGNYRNPHEVCVHAFDPFLDDHVIPTYHVYLRAQQDVHVKPGPIVVTLRDMDPELL